MKCGEFEGWNNDLVISKERALFDLKGEISAYCISFKTVDEVDAGVGCSAKLNIGTNSGRDIVSEIDSNRPCHLIIHNHPTYGNHSVLAVGYINGDTYE